MGGVSHQRCPRRIGSRRRVAVDGGEPDGGDRSPEAVVVLGIERCRCSRPPGPGSAGRRGGRSPRGRAPLRSETDRARRFHSNGELSSQNRAISVCSAVRALGVVTPSPPRRCTSLTSAAYLRHWSARTAARDGTGNASSSTKGVRSSPSAGRRRRGCPACSGTPRGPCPPGTSDQSAACRSRPRRAEREDRCGGRLAPSAIPFVFALPVRDRRRGRPHSPLPRSATPAPMHCRREEEGERAERWRRGRHAKRRRSRPSGDAPERVLRRAA